MTRRPLAALAVVVTLTLAGCTAAVDGTGRPGAAVTAAPLGEDGADASAAVDQVVSDLLALPHGFAVSVGGGGFTVDSRYQGGNGRARLTVGSGTADVVGVDHVTWVEGDADFWTTTGRLDAGRAQTLLGSWVEVGGSITGFAQYVDAKVLLGQVFDDKQAVFGKASTVDGRRVQQILVDDRLTIAVSLASPHVIVTYGDDATTTFTYPDDDLAVAVPSPVVDYPG